MKKILLTNIQRFCFHDGPGIRTTIFLKGCSLCCPWCSNPENLEIKPQEYIKDGIKGLYGQWYTIGELYKEIMKDEAFYNINQENSNIIGDFNITKAIDINRLPGGVTFSGGEALLQMEVLQPLLRKLSDERIHMTIETSLFIFPGLAAGDDALAIALNYIDLFYIDIKILDKHNCMKIIHGDIKVYFSNLERVLNSGKPVILRIPVIGGYTDGDKNREAVAGLIKSMILEKKRTTNILKIELIKEHKLGISKYKSLKAINSSITVPCYLGVSDKMMEDYKRELDDIINVAMKAKGNNIRSIPVEICKI